MKFILVLTLIFSMFSGTSQAEQKQTLVLNSSRYAPITSPDKTGVLDLFYKELSKRLDIEIVIQYLPAERALINANSGIDDGDVCRIFELNTLGDYPNLIRVPEAIMKFEMIIFTVDSKVVIRGPEDLKPYDVGIVTGWKFLEQHTSHAHSVVHVEEGRQLFVMLENHRIDIAIIEKTVGMKLLKDSGYKDIKTLDHPFLEGYWYLYLNKKHEVLIPKIVEKIKAMKKDGTYKKIFSKVIE